MSDELKTNRQPPTANRYHILFPAAVLGLGFLFYLLFSQFLPPAKLVLQSQPPGATVFINGQLAGATPLCLPGLKAGLYGLRLEREGYAPLVKALRFSKSALLTEKLAPAKSGALLVEITPAGAEILLDGEFIGLTPLCRDDILAGTYEMMVRKTNFKTRVWPAAKIEAGKRAEFKDAALEDTILTMLHSAIETEKQRVAHYMDLGHYLFINNQLVEAAQAYGQALEVAGTPLVFPPNTEAAEQQAEKNVRQYEVPRLIDEIHKKMDWKGKEVARFRALLEQKEDDIAGGDCKEWLVVGEIAKVKINAGKLEQAQALYLKFIGAAQDNSQAYISLLAVRLKLHNFQGLRETHKKILELYGQRPDLLRQAGNELYRSQEQYRGEERKEMLALAETCFRQAILTGERESKAQCKFELGLVLFYQDRAAEAVDFFQQSIKETNDEATKETRSERLLVCLRKLNRYEELRAVLTQLSHSQRQDTAKKAKEELEKLK